MLLSELYASRQGEGFLAGTFSVFIRTSGCNLRCGFCDTPFASWQPEGESQSIEQIVHRVHEVADGAKHVVITGGEPMLPMEIVRLTEALQDDFHITIETAGTLDRPVACDLMSISPKLSNSDPDLNRAGPWRDRHRERRMRPEVVDTLIARYPYQIKFVVDQPEDLDEIEYYLDQLRDYDRSRVLLMPQGTEAEALSQREAWLGPLCEARGFQLCRRMHIQWYGNRRGT